MHTKAKPSEFAGELHARPDAESPRPAEAGSVPLSGVPSFDPGPLNDLKEVMEAAKFVALASQLTQGLEARLGHLAKLLEESRWAEAAQGAHDIVSVAGNVGAMRLSALARNLERACKTGSDTERGSAAADLRNESVGALNALKSHQDTV